MQNENRQKLMPTGLGACVCAGLFRHGSGPGLFVSDYQNWDLQPDAVTFVRTQPSASAQPSLYLWWEHRSRTAVSFVS